MRGFVEAGSAWGITPKRFAGWSPGQLSVRELGAFGSAPLRHWVASRVAACFSVGSDEAADHLQSTRFRSIFRTGFNATLMTLPCHLKVVVVRACGGLPFASSSHSRILGNRDPVDDFRDRNPGERTLAGEASRVFVFKF
jgi:hypothetical protein